MEVQPGNKWLRAAMIAWAILAVAASVKTVIDPESHTVYTAFSHGSRDWWDGNSLYIDRAYYYSPTFAILMTPLAIWPDWYGGVLWNFASVGLLAWSLRMFYRNVLRGASGVDTPGRAALAEPVAHTPQTAEALSRAEPVAPRDLIPFPVERSRLKRVAHAGSALAEPVSPRDLIPFPVERSLATPVAHMPARSTNHQSPLAAHSKLAEPVAHKAEAAFHFLVLFGSVRSIWSGQSNAILVALVLFAGAAIVRRRWGRAAVLLAAPIYIKIWPIAVAGLLGIQWPRRLAMRLAACTVALGLIPFLTKLPAAVISAYSEWSEGLVNRQATQFRFTGYRDAWTIWEQFQSPVNKQAYFMLQVAAGLATLGWCLWQCRRGRSDRQLVVYTIAAWSAWQLLFGPGTERLTYNLIAPALAWATIRSFETGRGRLWITLTYMMTFVLGLGGVERSLVAIFPAATAFEPIGVLMFAGWLVWYAAYDDCAKSRSVLIWDVGTPALASRAA